MNSLRFLLLTVLLGTASLGANAQIFFTENFEGTAGANGLPTGWTETGLSSDGIWTMGDATAAAGPYLSVPAAIQGTNFAFTSDDACNCDKSVDRMIMPAQNFSTFAGANLIFDAFVPGTYGGIGTVEVSTDGGTTWTPIFTIPTNAAWQDDVTVSLASVVGAGNTNVLISFLYNDGAAWADAMAIDEVRLEQLTVLNPDMALTAISGSEYTITPLTQVTPLSFSADVVNAGSANATDASLTVNVYDATNLTTPIQTLSSATSAVNTSATATLNAAGTFTATTAANYVFEYITTATGDANTANDTAYSSLAVTNNLYARDDASVVFNAGIGAGPLGYLGSMYTITTATPLDSVLVAFTKPGTDNVTGDGVGDSTRVVIFDVAGGLPNVEIGRSDAYVFTVADTLGLITHTFAINATAGGTLMLAPGTYFVAAEENNTNLGLSFTDNNFQLNTFYFSWTGQPWTAAENFPAQFQRVPVIRPILGCALSATTSSTDATCTGGNGSATITPTGVAPYTYSWSNSATTATANNLTAGTYTVTVTDNIGCELVESVTVTSNSVALTASNTTTNSACGGSTGSATVTATNGTSPYTYLWSDAQTTQTAANLAAGSYNVTITDANGCTGAVSGIIVNNPNSPTSSAAVTSNFNGEDVSCNGFSDGEANVTASGGTAPYTYNWTNGQTTTTATALAAGVYSVTVTDNASCSSVSAVTITEPTIVAINAATTTDVNCNAGSDGAIDLTVAGGTGAYTFSWSNGSTTEDLTGLVAGAYTGTITDANGCSIVGGPLTINEPTALSGAATQTDVSCNGATDGSATATISGGTSPYTYSWSDGQTTMMATGLAANTYMATVTDDNGCTFMPNAVTVTEPTAISAGVTATDASTAGGADGTVDLAPAGGTAPYTFVWDNGATTEDLSAVAAGTYSVTITDANGCTHVASGTVLDGPSSIGMNANNIEVNLFPNPAKDQAVLTLNLTQLADVNVEVVNVTGQVLTSINSADVLNTQFELNMTDWAAGVYFVRITAGQETATMRLIKQ